MEVVYVLAFPVVVMLGGFLVFERVLWAFVMTVRFVRRVAGQPE